VTYLVLKGLIEFRASVDATVARMDAAVRLATGKAAHLIEQRAKQALTTSSHPRGTPTPSAAGEPPSLVSGTLRRSIAVVGPTAVGFATYRADIGPTVAYGRIQELGGSTAHGVLPARPYMAPVFNAASTQLWIREIFRTELNKAVRL
jgi:phage gpG-like protein